MNDVQFIMVTISLMVGLAIGGGFCFAAIFIISNLLRSNREAKELDKQTKHD